MYKRQGAGINGLVAANYLIKHGLDVSVVEKKPNTGGACVKDSAIIENKNIDFAYGATVLGMMPNFIFQETGLSDKIEGYYPKTPKLVYFNDEESSTKIYQDYVKLEKELYEKWGEKGRVNEFRNDENKVVKFIQKLYRNATSPSVDIANDHLGKDLTSLWITGSAKNLLDHYFSSEKTKLYMGMTVIESGPASIYDPGTAFTIPLMDSGSIFDGYWGFVKTGIWKITENLTEINRRLGVKFYLDSEIQQIDNKSNSVSFSQKNREYKLNYDHLIFATDPVTPSKLINDFNNNIDLDLIGTSGKVTAFFKNPVRWKDSNNYSDSFRFIFSVDSLNSFEDASQNALNDLDNKEAKNLNDIKEKIISTVMPHIENPEDLVYSKFLTPKDLNETFLFPKGNIDHSTLTGDQNYNKRTFSDNKDNFYSYYDYENIFYCGAGSFPCGSVAGTPGYMCSKQLIRNL